MQRHKPAAARHVIQQGLFLGRIDFVDVRIQQQGIVFVEILRIQVDDIIGINQLDAPLGEHGLDLHKPLPRPMMPVVPQEQHFEDPSPTCGLEGTRQAGDANKIH